MTDRAAAADLNAAKYRADLAIDALFRDAGAVVAEAVRRHARETPEGLRLDDAARKKILAEVDGVLGPLYGRRPGDPGQVGRLVLRSAARTWAGVMRGTADEIAARLAEEPALVARLEGT